MLTFRQWHNEDCVFHRETKLTFGQCGENHALSLQELLLLTSDTAVEDYHQRGLTWQFLCDHDTAILVSRVSLHILKMPQANELLTIRTWEETPQSIQLARAYEILDTETNETLITGRSTWIVVNLKTRRITPAKQFTLRKAPERTLPFDGIPCGKITLPEQASLLEKRVVRYSDIDGNGHTNNSRYAAYIMDCLPEKYQQLPLADIRINYSKEAVKGGTIEIFGIFDDAERKITVAGKQQNEICFECELYWKT